VSLSKERLRDWSLTLTTEVEAKRNLTRSRQIFCVRSSSGVLDSFVCVCVCVCVVLCVCVCKRWGGTDGHPIPPPRFPLAGALA
jgi:hypothetical protein